MHIGKAIYLSIEWRIIATIIMFVATWLLTGNIGLTISVAILDVTTKTVGHAIWLWVRNRKKEHKVICPECEHEHVITK